MGATCGNAQHALHHPFPLFTVRGYPAKVLPHQQVRQLMGHHFIDKRLLIFPAAAPDLNEFRFFSSQAVPAEVPRCW